jgi:hypothetical protein
MINKELGQAATTEVDASCVVSVGVYEGDETFIEPRPITLSWGAGDSPALTLEQAIALRALLDEAIELVR